MDVSSFSAEVEQYLEQLYEHLEEVDEEGKLDIDVLEGVLTISLEDGKEYVINRHEPTLQIWVSSPLSGAGYFSYDEDDEAWHDEDGQALEELLSDELDGLIGISLDL